MNSPNTRPKGNRHLGDLPGFLPPFRSRLRLALAKPGQGGGFSVDFEPIEVADEIGLTGLTHPLVEVLRVLAHCGALGIQPGDVFGNGALQEIVGTLGIQVPEEDALNGNADQLIDQANANLRRCLDVR